MPDDIKFPALTVPDMPLLFSYGTLQQENVQLSTFGRLLHGHKDQLVGFEESLVKIEDPKSWPQAARHITLSSNSTAGTTVV